VPIGSIMRDTVYFTVHHEAPYIITHYIKSSSHLSMEIPEYPSMPGQKGILPIELNTRDFTEGKLRNLISVQGNNGPNHRYLLYVKADLYLGERIVQSRKP
jgi:hypothetical protein